MRIVLIQRLTGFHHLDQFVHKTGHVCEIRLRIIKVMFFVKHVVQKYIVLPQKVFKYTSSDKFG